LTGGIGDGDGLALSADGTDSLSVTGRSVVGCAAADSFAARASRLTPAIEAHRLTQLCATSCFFAAAFTPSVRASATTSARSSAVYLRLVLLDSIPTSDRLRPRPGYVRDCVPSTDGQMVDISNYCVGWMRQQENQQLGIPLDVAKGFSPRLRKPAGFGLYKRLLGHIDKCSPTDLLDGTPPRRVVGEM